MDFCDRLYERLEFYKKAYEDASKDEEKMQSEFEKSDKLLCTGIANALEESIPAELPETAVNGIEREFNVELNDVWFKCNEQVKKYEEDIKIKKANSRYEEYLKLIMDEDLKTVIDMEQDQVFAWLVEQDFHNEHFVNEPYLEILGFKYQPRLWKFAGIADKKAREFGLTGYKAMFKLWKNLRINYTSLSGDEKITEVIKECKQLETEIKSLEDQIGQMPVQYRIDLITRLVAHIRIQPVEFLDKQGIVQLIPLKKIVSGLEEALNKLSERMNQIMDNITNVEKMVSAYEIENAVRNEKTYERFFNNTDPTVPVFELIPEDEWKDIERAFNEKNIKLKSRENYNIVRTKISQDEKEAILDKYGVKEGEIFIKESLKNN